ncbi:MAG TPA: hypothetical protein VMJ12_18175 [Candidatus Acidoferrales bacterium]|nr:hypothetical protein [Candidatus Acidoferrales bacterium]
MNRVTTHKEIFPDAVLKAVIIYDDFDAATRATMLLERVGARAGEAIKWDIKPWRYDVLKQPTLAALTIAVAANADLIVLALYHTPVPPAGLLDWLKNWAEHRRVRDAAVLTLQADSGSRPATAWNEIKAFVEGHHLTFLGSHEVSTDKNSGSFAHRSQPRKPLVGAAPQRSSAERLAVPQHWGMNE